MAGRKAEVFPEGFTAFDCCTSKKTPYVERFLGGRSLGAGVLLIIDVRSRHKVPTRPAFPRVSLSCFFLPLGRKTVENPFRDDDPLGHRGDRAGAGPRILLHADASGGARRGPARERPRTARTGRTPAPWRPWSRCR